MATLKNPPGKPDEVINVYVFGENPHQSKGSALTFSYRERYFNLQREHREGAQSHVPTTKPNV